MPRFNFYFILFVILVYVLTADISFRDCLLVSTLHKIEREAYFEPSAKDLFEGAIRGMTKVLSYELGDGYSVYIPSSEQTRYQDFNNNRYDGFGFSTNLYEEGGEKKLFIVYPLYKSPAYCAGLRSGDQLLQIDDTPITNKTDIEIVKLSKHQPQQEFRFSVLPFGQTEPQDFFIRPEKLRSDSVKGDYFDSDKRFFCLETYPLIGYIQITSFVGTTAHEFGGALDIMMQSGAKSFILDLRDNGGGDVWNCIQIAHMLMSPDSDRNVIASSWYRNGYEGSFTLKGTLQRCTLPMVVLIDGESASATELLAAALQDYHRATIVGTRSFGKGIIQSIIDLPFQSGILQLTYAEYRRPSGANIHRRANATDSDDWGVIPDKKVEISDTERSAVLEYRQLRSNVISTQRSEVLDQFRRQIIEKHREEEEGQQQFEFTGAAPYYDVQLDEAIKILLNCEE